MMTEDDLRDQLREEAASVRPPGDLIETLSLGHARRHRRAARMKIGGVAVATALVATALTTVFAASRPSVQAAEQAKIIDLAKAADAKAQDKIMHVTSTGPGQVHEAWLLRSTKQTRGFQVGVADVVVDPTGTVEMVHYSDKTAWKAPKRPRDDSMSAYLLAAGIPDVTRFLAEPTLTASRDEDGNINLLLPGVYGRLDRMSLDPKTYLPVSAEANFFKSTIEWLPATADNLKLLHHAVPPDFTRVLPPADSPPVNVPHTIPVPPPSK
jgi:hypothetical protein